MMLKDLPPLKFYFEALNAWKSVVGWQKLPASKTETQEEFEERIRDVL